LTEVKETNAQNQVVLDETFTYDVNNNLIGETVNGVQQRWTVYDGANPYLDLTASGQVSERYITDPTGLDTFWARVNSSGVADWYVTDALGSVRDIVSPTGTVLDTLTYDAYGSILSESSPSNGDRFKYAGGQYDSGLGLINFCERWYKPTDGGWISQDPLGLRPDTNPYRYVDNAPTNGTDPTGLKTKDHVPHDRVGQVVSTERRWHFTAGSVFFISNRTGEDDYAEIRSHLPAGPPRSIIYRDIANWTQIARTLSGYPAQSVPDIYISGHGSSLGGIAALGRHLSADSLTEEAIMQIRRVLRPGGRVILLGCEQGTNPGVRRLARDLGVPIVANTGGCSGGNYGSGDWVRIDP
jgi:RHS repeat-associated protein